MANKDLLLPFGERNTEPADIDELLKMKVAEKKRKEIERQEEIDEAKHTADMAKYHKQAKLAETPPEKPEGKSDGGFKVTGGVNLGNIDLDAERKQAAQELKDLKKEQEDTIRAVGTENEKLRDQIHEKELKVLEITLKSQMDAQMAILNRMIEGNASKGSFADQLDAARTIAKELGYAQPSGGSGDLNSQLALKKLEFENARELRRLAKEDRAEEKRWKLELMKLEDSRAEEKAKQDREDKKNELFSKEVGPLVNIGLALAGKAGGVAKQADETPETSPEVMSAPVIQAGEGEEGSAACYRCKSMVKIMPETKVAVCGKCGMRYPVRRIPVSVTTEEAPVSHTSAEAAARVAADKAARETDLNEEGR